MKTKKKMMKRKIIIMLTGICTLFAACSEQEENESLINSAIKGEEAVDVSLSLSLSPEIYLSGTTEYQPMSTRAGEATGEVDPNKLLTIVQNIYKCLVIKEINEQWYVERTVESILTNEIEKDKNVGVTAKPNFNDLQLTLQPGHYRILAVLNPKAVAWNKALVPGASIKNQEDTITHAYTYLYIMSNYCSYNPTRFVNGEVFAGTAEFTVEKTPDLHSVPIINGNRTINFSRKVMYLRYLLKYYEKAGSTNFQKSQHSIYATLTTTEPKTFFCDGLDCWGKAYYNLKKPRTKMKVYTDVLGEWREYLPDNTKYLMTARNATTYSPFVFTDDEQSVPYQMEINKITGPTDPGYTYVYPSIIEGLTLTNNTIQQIVFRATNKVDNTFHDPGDVTLEHLEEEDSKYLFDKHYELTLTPIDPY